MRVSKQIGWSNEASLYYEILKELEGLYCTLCGVFSNTTTTTTSSSSTTTSTTSSTTSTTTTESPTTTTTSTTETPLNFNYGYLYNWYAATDTRGIASAGWHMPSVIELSTLAVYLGGQPTAGGPLKDVLYVHWDSPNTGATNTSKYNLVGSGQRGSDFILLKAECFLWTSTASAFMHSIYNSTVFNVSGYAQSYLKYVGMAIRLIKNSTSLSPGETGTYTGNDGTVYPTICVGTQEWLAINLYETEYANHDLITVVTDQSIWSTPLTTEARCVYNNDESNK